MTVSNRTHIRLNNGKHTQLLHLGLVTLAGADRLLVGLGHLHGTLKRDVPAVALGIAGSLQRMRVTMKLEGDFMRVSLLELGGVVEREDVLGVRLGCLSLLVEEQEALAGLAGPCNDRVRDFRLLATHIQVQVLRRHGGVAEPELLLCRKQRPTMD